MTHKCQMSQKFPFLHLTLVMLLPETMLIIQPDQPSALQNASLPRLIATFQVCLIL